MFNDKTTDQEIVIHILQRGFVNNAVSLRLHSQRIDKMLHVPLLPSQKFPTCFCSSRHCRLQCIITGSKNSNNLTEVIPDLPFVILSFLKARWQSHHTILKHVVVDRIKCKGVAGTPHLFYCCSCKQNQMQRARGT